MGGVKTGSGGGVAAIRNWTQGSVSLKGLEQLHGVAVLAGWATGLSILSIEEQLRSQIASWRCVWSAFRVTDEAALFAQNGAFLHALVADAAYDG